MLPLDSKFFKQLSDWLEKNDQKAAQYFKNNKAKVPQMFRGNTQELYRGMSVTEGFLDSLSKSPMIFNTFTSWTKKKEMAEKFTNDPAYKIGNGVVKILIKKRMYSQDIILDVSNIALFLKSSGMIELGIDDLAADSAMKEFEVLCDKNIKIYKNEVILL